MKRAFAALAIGACALACPQAQAADDYGTLVKMREANQTNGITPAALETLRKEAENGSASAAASVGYLYASGSGVERDDAEAVRWWRIGAERGDMSGEFNLGNMLFRGMGISKNVPEAMQWWQRAALQGMPEAQNNMGATNFDGVEVRRNYILAYAWLNAAVTNGFDHSREKRDLAEAKLSPTDLEKAKALSAHIIHKERGDMTTSGEGRPVISESEKDAVAQFRFGNAYHDGTGVVKDDAKAVQWWRRAADQNILSAQLALGHAYENGMGVPKDTKEAARWYSKAAEQNDGDAQKFLGQLYERGDGVPKDEVKAYALYSLSSDAYGGDAIYHLTELSKRLTPEQIAEGQKFVEHYKAQKQAHVKGDTSSAPGHGSLFGGITMIVGSGLLLLAAAFISRRKRSA